LRSGSPGSCHRYAFSRPGFAPFRKPAHGFRPSPIAEVQNQALSTPPSAIERAVAAGSGGAVRAAETHAQRARARARSAGRARVLPRAWLSFRDHSLVKSGDGETPAAASEPSGSLRARRAATSAPSGAGKIGASAGSGSIRSLTESSMRKYLTEFIGTFFLVFTVGLTVTTGAPWRACDRIGR